MNQTVISMTDLQTSLDARVIWAEALMIIKEKVSQPSYQTWFCSIHPTVEENTFVLETSSAFAAEWLRNRYFHLITDALVEVVEEIRYVEIRSMLVEDIPLAVANDGIHLETQSQKSIYTRLRQMEEKLDTILFLLQREKMS
ncbi:DnaA N-terminal domain-containing protein [Thermoactinomyces sp. DSM 45892]|uniref:DnaA N-terminal domain-containing protein n=1 Tax=Thermoactinomyces sp. DSM 45892 TaxID=1882753 RepID=UPI00089AF598|nr:DnaA N-terminal domain-containing protein [Thermoactinomyces sp. DSM 45892]SDY62411.1 DnaA N-terminal domain-containing protein [Thermoactinomyces sp. DSM 45892]